MKYKYKVSLKHSYDYLGMANAPEIFESYRGTVSEAIEEFCREKFVRRSDILEFVPLVISKDGPGLYGEGYRTQNDYYDKPASAFKAHTVHPTKLVGTLWRDSNNRFLDYLLKITKVSPSYSSPLNPYDLTKWEVEYVEINPRTMEVVKGDFFGVINPTYKRMNLAEFMKKYYCDKM